MFRFNITAIYGCIFCMFDFYFIICIGRFIFGFSCGVITCASTKMLEEMIPDMVRDDGYLSVTNLFLSLNLAFIVLLRLLLHDIEDLDIYNNEIGWRLVLIFPVPFHIISCLLTLYTFKEEPLIFMARTGETSRGMNQMTLIYPDEMHHVREAIY